LGKMQQMQSSRTLIENARKLVDQNDDKITKSDVKALEEEPLGDADDDVDMDTRTIGGKSTGTGAGR
jgi:transcription initiation factor TFIID subunit 13